MSAFKYILLILFYVLSDNAHTQTSFTKELSATGLVPWLSKIGVGEQSKSSVMIPKMISTNIYNFDKNGEKINAYQIVPEPFEQTNFVVPYRRMGDQHFLALSTLEMGPFDLGKSALIMMNFHQNNYWGLQTSSRSSGIFPLNFHITESGKVITALNFDITAPSQLSLAQLETNSGNINWKYKFKAVGIQNIRSYQLNRINEFPDKNLSVSFSAFNNILSINRSGILKLSPSGELLDNIILNRDSAEFIYDEDHGIDGMGNLYIGGTTLPLFRTGTVISPRREGFIAKFDSNFNLIWAKKLAIENFPLKRMTIKVAENGEIQFLYGTFGDLPVISGKISSDGELLENRGYSMFDPDFSIGEDGSLYFVTGKKYLNNGSSEPATIIVKTNPDGSIENCPQFDACLSLEDIDLPLTKWDWEREITPDLDTFQFKIDSIDFTLTDHCGTPRPPTPYFTLPDTVCQNTALKPDSIYNHLAHATEWTITGKNTDRTIIDTTFLHRFIDPGTYQIEQEIWLLGCSEFFTRTLVVLPDSLGNLLGEDRLICEDNPLSLSPTAARPLRSFEWSDGSQNSSITISNSGTYAVTASDGFCSASDEVELTFFKEKYPNEVFELPTDSAVCVDLLPLSLVPTSEFTDSFYLADSTIPQTVFELKTEGNYQISAQIENCRVEKNFELKITPCEIDIFIPNTFSPNDDGINDFAEPFGKEFDGLSLEIFNRWGGKVFETTSTPFAWNGNFDGKKANEGVYVFVFKYRNRRNGQEEMVSGDVLLMR